MTVKLRQLTNKDRWAYGLFWSWNIIFLAFMGFGFAPRMLPELLNSVQAGDIPASFLINGLALSLIPLITVILGLTVLRNAPASLFALGYVVEGPLMLMLAVRLFLIRQGNPGLTLVMVITGLGMAAFLWQLLDPEIEKRGRLAGYLRLLGLTLMLLASLYAALWIAFYAFPAIVAAFAWLLTTLTKLASFLSGLWAYIKELFTQRLAWLPFELLGLVLLLYTATLVVLTPIAVPVLSIRAWWRNFQLQRDRQGWQIPALLVAGTIAITAILFILSNRQPQRQAFELLETPPTSQEQASNLINNQETIRAGLLNAYLAPYRYISSMGGVRHVSDLYEYVFKMSPQRAFGVQQLYESIAQPLLYKPVHPPESEKDSNALAEDPAKAAQLYQNFFDKPIAEGERDAVVHAVRSTWSGEQARAAWQVVDEREVLLTHQEINIREHGDWADVELYEVYQNQTSSRQEVIYYFSLPESAVITGVWLGNSPDRSERFSYNIAPRGAAQAVYRNEVRANQDPALVEQIGPRQYRLRIFPVEPRRARWDESMDTWEAPSMHMWLTYRTFADGDSWPLPQLAVKRNVFWDNSTQRLVNGSPQKINTEIWLPESVPASQAVSQIAHRFDLPGGESVMAIPAAQVDLPTLPSNLRWAVVLDRSRSMQAHAGQVTDALERLEQVTGSGSAVDVYLTSSLYRGEGPSIVSLAQLDPQNIMYFGGQNAADLLAQFIGLSANRNYDAILVLTDGSGYELVANKLEEPVPQAPVWMLHLGDDISIGYDDKTLEAIQASGGGVVGNLEQAFERIAMARSEQGSTLASERLVRDVVDGYVWTVEPTAQAEPQGANAIVHDPQDGFGAFAARRLILAEMQRQQGTITQLSTLDQLHALAQEYSIVTPYSSMIVLVNSRQQNLLDKMELQDDRFEREYEPIQNTTPTTQMPLTGVPEPEEWLLIGLAVAMLLWYANQRRLATQKR
jgi:putative PEP-CTERM system integral membrane protein